MSAEFRLIEELQSVGINVADINKLKEVCVLFWLSVLFVC